MCWLEDNQQERYHQIARINWRLGFAELRTCFGSIYPSHSSQWSSCPRQGRLEAQSARPLDTETVCALGQNSEPTGAEDDAQRCIEGGNRPRLTVIRPCRVAAKYQAGRRQRTIFHVGPDDNQTNEDHHCAVLPLVSEHLPDRDPRSASPVPIGWSLGKLRPRLSPSVLANIRSPGFKTLNLARKRHVVAKKPYAQGVDFDEMCRVAKMCHRWMSEA